VETYIDHGISGAKQKRLAFSRMCKDAMRRKFDVLWRERSIVIGRSVHDDVSGFMVEMETLGLKLYYYKRAIETARPAGKAMIHMCIVVSEFERDVIRKRVNQGFARAQPPSCFSFDAGRGLFLRALVTASATNDGFIRLVAMSSTPLTSASLLFAPPQESDAASLETETCARRRINGQL
jgi:hypothetical protein